MSLGALYSATATSICLPRALCLTTTTYKTTLAESGHATHGIGPEGTAV